MRKDDRTLHPRRSFVRLAFPKLKDIVCAFIYKFLDGVTGDQVRKALLSVELLTRSKAGNATLIMEVISDVVFNSALDYYPWTLTHQVTKTWARRPVQSERGTTALTTNNGSCSNDTNGARTAHGAAFAANITFRACEYHIIPSFSLSESLSSRAGPPFSVGYVGK